MGGAGARGRESEGHSGATVGRDGGGESTWRKWATRGVALSESALAALKSVTCMGHPLGPSKASGLTADTSSAPLGVTDL